MTTSAVPIPPVIFASDLSIRYPSRRPDAQDLAVNGVTFSLEQGEIVAVVGESGSGKSTLAAAVAGAADTGNAHDPVIHGGKLRVLGYTMKGISDRKRDLVTLRVGYLRQDGGEQLSGRLTVAENVAAPIFERDRRFNQREANEAVATLIDSVRLPLGILNRYPHELSRGQRQRVAMAQALILEPALFVADDPTSGIDPTVRSAILDVIRELQARRHFSALLVSSDLDEVRRISDQVIVMHRGAVVGQGQVDQVLAAPAHPYVEGLARSRRRPTAPTKRISV
ncbi:ABC-type glutathione transport system ATPase component [Conyzicola lurida]|uniref:ABC-type glutathione transport system ATPase component n=1 Tax=Conyzicola lurida TaxID=1172621 RepID=A0A841AP94_9MICO|nr:ATP-binding cassette domain-containing protein [Conyzicola lurida]MBB5843375.1 ABC-type glutathione transport system ATPase component [Conyzicola lurida]